MDDVDLLPNRYVAPLAAFGGFFVMVMSSQTAPHDMSGWPLILPTNSAGNFQQDSGIFYPWLPDLPIARIMLLAGITVAAAGLAGLPPAAGGRRLRMTAAVVTAAGVAVAGTAVGLATTARMAPNGMVVPALHDAGSDRAIAYTPVCGGSGFRVCVNPAYKGYLTDVEQALAPAAGEVAGLPGAPVRAVQSAAVYNSAEGQAGQPMTIAGNPPVLSVPIGAYDFLPGPIRFRRAPDSLRTFDQSMWVAFFDAFTGAGSVAATPAQQAVRAVLLQGIGVPFAAQPRLVGVVGVGPTQYSVAAPGPVYDAARRLAAQPASVRHAWLASHLAALRAGQLTLKQIP